jgi:replicative superfamily II helicase
MTVEAIDYICNRVINSFQFEANYNKLFLTISQNRFNGVESNPLTKSEYKNLLKYCDLLSNSEKSTHRNLALKIISSLYELYKFDENCQLVAKSILNKFGLFSAEEIFVEQKFKLPFSVEVSSNYRKRNQRIGNTQSIFTNAQFEIHESIINNKHFSFSGPTSLGKSFLLKNTALDLIETQQNIVFLLPTKALLEEYLFDIRALIKERKVESVNVTKSVSGVKLNSKNIMVFTQERFNSYLYEEAFKDLDIDVLFIDEAHKLAEKRSKRAITLYKVIRKTIDNHSDVKIVFSSPVISNPESFFNTFDLTKKTNSLVVRESPVTQNLYFIDIKGKGVKYFDNVTKNTISFALDDNLDCSFKLISEIGKSYHSNLVFISSKMECVNKCSDFLNFMIENKLVKKSEDEDLLNESKFLSDFVHKDFKLANFIKYGVAIHNGSLPIFIRKRIEDLYARKKIKYIFCTSTLLEGVNLPTQNVFIFPFSSNVLKNKGKCNLDFWNLAGRAGRYKNEMSGNIICIGETEKSWELVQESAKANEPIDVEDGIKALLNKHIKILNYLNGKTKNSDSNIVKLSSLILSEVMNFNKGLGLGKILQGYTDVIREKLIDASTLHLERKGISEIDVDAFASNHDFDTDLQSKAFEFSKKNKNLLKSYNREDVFKYIETINQIYELRNPKSLLQLQIVVYSWLMGDSLSLLIKNAIKYGNKVRDPHEYKWVDFDINNSEHVNQKILETIACIEDEITFKLENCCSHFYQLCKSVRGEAKSGVNLAPLLEYGTMEHKEIEVQDFGFSRMAASELVKNYKHCISFTKPDDKVVIDINKLKQSVKPNSLIGKELTWIAK